MLVRVLLQLSRSKRKKRIGEFFSKTCFILTLMVSFLSSQPRNVSVEVENQPRQPDR